MVTRVIVLLTFGLAWPATAFAHMGRWQFTLPFASFALGITLGLLSLFLRSSARFYVAVAVAAAMVALALIYNLPRIKPSRPETLGGHYSSPCL